MSIHWPEVRACDTAPRYAQPRLYPSADQVGGVSIVARNLVQHRRPHVVILRCLCLFTGHRSGSFSNTGTRPVIAVFRPLPVSTVNLLHPVQLVEFIYIAVLRSVFSQCICFLFVWVTLSALNTFVFKFSYSPSTFAHISFYVVFYHTFSSFSIFSSLFLKKEEAEASSSKLLLTFFSYSYPSYQPSNNNYSHGHE